jgi:Domain of unknown function (DUF4336)
MPSSAWHGLSLASHCRKPYKQQAKHEAATTTPITSYFTVWYGLRYPRKRHFFTSSVKPHCFSSCDVRDHLTTRSDARRLLEHRILLVRQAHFLARSGSIRRRAMLRYSASLLFLLSSLGGSWAFLLPLRPPTTSQPPQAWHWPTASSSTTTTSSSTTTTQLDAQAPSSSGLSRRQVGELAVAATGIGISITGTREVKDTDYGLWGILPVGPYKTKKTIRETIVENQVWTFDQKFGILNVQVPLRMTLIKMSTGGLLCYNPIAATPECLRLVDELVKVHGPIRHIIVGSVALEHKAYAGVFAQKFPTAQVWLQPGQYSFPANLPNSFLGFPSSRTRTMPRSLADAPPEWQPDFDFRTLGPIISRDGAFGETVVYHKPTGTLLCTDTVVQVTDEVPAIYESDHAPLLYHARDTIADIVQDTPETLKKGWKRVVLFGLYFMPAAITIKDINTALNERRPDINPDFVGVYPWDWDLEREKASWDAIAASSDTRGGAGLLVAPILQVLLLNRSPEEVLDFADEVSKWPIQRIIPAHLKNNLRATGADYRRAFSFLEARGVPAGSPKPLAGDLQALRDAEVSLIESGAIVPAPPAVGGTISRGEILAQTVYQCRAGVCQPKASP